ncbi:hypothetical protein PHBOTO_005398 [Pseudozyma hubeiensis]|nr:hypothetical protein PHBOTO_005398 [Pseudozyma hubeiensis]
MLFTKPAHAGFVGSGRPGCKASWRVKVVMVALSMCLLSSVVAGAAIRVRDDISKDAPLDPRGSDSPIPRHPIFDDGTPGPPPSPRSDETEMPRWPPILDREVQASEDHVEQPNPQRHVVSLPELPSTPKDGTTFLPRDPHAPTKPDDRSSEHQLPMSAQVAAAQDFPIFLSGQF